MSAGGFALSAKRDARWEQLQAQVGLEEANTGDRLAGGGRVWTELGKKPGLSELVDKIKLVWFKPTFLQCFAYALGTKKDAGEQTSNSSLILLSILADF